MSESIDINKIFSLIPHRYPFILVDRVLDYKVMDYLNGILQKCEKQIIFIKKLEKIDENNISIPTIYNYVNITKYNYTIQQLRTFAIHYKLKTGGTRGKGKSV